MTITKSRHPDDQANPPDDQANPVALLLHGYSSRAIHPGLSQEYYLAWVQGVEHIVLTGRCIPRNSTMRVLLIIVTLCAPAFAIACATSPIYRIAQHPAEFLDIYGAVFLGEVVEIRKVGQGEQEVEMQVLQTFKGQTADRLTIRNSLTTSCSNLMTEAESPYYIFGNYDAGKNEIDMEGFPGFVSERIALEFEMAAKLPDAKP